MEPREPSVRAFAVRFATFAVGWQLLAGTGSAQSFSVTAEVVAGCAVTGSGATTGLEFGALDFGSHPAVGMQSLNASTLLSGGTLEMRCTPGLSLQVSLGDGLHAQSGQRHLVHTGAPGEKVPYALYADADKSTPFPPATPLSMAVPADGLLVLPVYGVATLTATGKTPGEYRDVVSVTIAW
jgi:spore coat protein U-like protein